MISSQSSSSAMAAVSLRNHRTPLPLFRCFFFSPSPQLIHLQNPSFLTPKTNFSRVLNSRSRSFSCLCKQVSSSNEVKSVDEMAEEIERPPFDISLAIVLAGFAFEAYSSPPENVGRREVDAADCATTYLSETFLNEVYDGQLFIKLKKGVDLPAMDPWGTSDPYVVMQLDGQVVKSKVKWATKEPTWNEDFTLNIKLPATENLQIAAWDANLVAPHKRMGNASISLETLCDGCLHEVAVELMGMGGGGKIHLEVKYKDFGDSDEEKQWWRIPFISNILSNNDFGPALEKVLGTDTVPARQFVQYAFGQLQSFDYSNKKNPSSAEEGSGESINLVGDSNVPLPQESSEGDSLNDSCKENENVLGNPTDNDDKGDKSRPEIQIDESTQSDNFWNDFADVLNLTTVQKLGITIPDQIGWDGFDLLNKMGLQSKSIAEAGYVKSGLAAPESQRSDDIISDQSSIVKVVQSSLPDIKKASWDVLKQTDSILGALMVLTTTFSQQNKEAYSVGDGNAVNETSKKVVDDVPRESSSEMILSSSGESSVDQRKAEEMKVLFTTAESAMEAWAMLATSLGRPSFIKSEFEKICFLDNETTDTQVAVWRDLPRRRLVVAFRGTEQVRWKDLRTDLMLAPTGLNPERIGGDFKQEVQVHSGFLSAYDSIRTKLMSLIKLSIGFTDDRVEVVPKWHIYVTGHSLGGALATLLALELSSSHMAKHNAISVTMYNFGSPRVGNRRFVDIYNKFRNKYNTQTAVSELLYSVGLKCRINCRIMNNIKAREYFLRKVKDSWRIVNHRDIIPTVPRLMGYCHVAHPIYLASGTLNDALANVDLSGDGYQADVIGEYTPDVLVSEFMKGEKDLIEKILQTEINIFRSIRDGSALMQHMEDFYYVSLLEHVQSNYRSGSSNSNELGSS